MISFLKLIIEKPNGLNLQAAAWIINSDFTFCHVKPLTQGLKVCFQMIKTTKQLGEL